MCACGTSMPKTATPTRLQLIVFSIAEATLRALEKMGLHIQVLSGDGQASVNQLASRLGIQNAKGTCSPEEKLKQVKWAQSQGHRVAMVGDGVNDAPALATADIGIAIGSGSDVAKEAGDIILMGNDVRLVVTAIGLSRATMRKIRQNLWWAFGYNIAMVPLAAAGVVNPMLAGAAMAASSVCVVFNSLRLNRVRQIMDVDDGLCDAAFFQPVNAVIEQGATRNLHQGLGPCGGERTHPLAEPGRHHHRCATCCS